jgi:hypothetical protein
MITATTGFIRKLVKGSAAIRDSFVLCLLATLVFWGPVRAQGLGSLVGAVTDPAGAVIPNAKVTVTEVGTGFSRTATTDSEGHYVLASMRPAQYDITVQAAGFITYAQKGVTLLANQTLTVNVTAQVSGTTEQLNITAGDVQVDTSTPTLKQVIEKERVQELPLNGRNAATLTLLVPGAIAAPSGGADQGSTKTFPGAVTIAANGARQNMISYSLDGGNYIDEYTNVNQPFPMPDALQEFSVQTSNYSAEYGQNAGAVVNVVTRSGTNSFHGDVFEFVRNEVFNARQWQAATRDHLKRNQFGGVFGGPIIHDRTFFFGAFQATRFRNIGGAKTTVVPSAALRGTATDPAVINLLKGIPVGDSNNQVSFARPDIQNFNEGLGKVDHSFNQNNTVSGRYFYNRFSRNAVFDPSNLLTYSDGSTIVSQNTLVEYTHVFSPSLLNAFRFSFANENASRGPASNAVGVTDLGVALPFQPATKAIQQIRVNGAFSFGDNPSATFFRRNFTWSDDVTWIHGKHDLRFGGTIERSQVDLNNLFFQPAEFSFPSITAFLAGQLGDYSGNVAFRQGAGEFKNNRNIFAGLYIQDNFHVSRRLTLNLGLRYEPFLPWHELKGRVQQFRLPDFLAGVHSTQFPNAPAGVFFPGDPGVPEDGVRRSLDNFAPRIGFAYDVFGDARTSLRGGFGIFYDTRINGIINNRFVDQTPFSPQFILSTATGAVRPGSFSDPLCTSAATQAALHCTSQSSVYPLPARFPPPKNTVFTLNQLILTWDPVNKYQVPTVYNWNLSLEHQLPYSILVRGAYVGSHSSHLTETLNLDPSPVGGGPRRLNAIAGKALFSDIQQDLQDINSSYNSLQLSFEKRAPHGVTILGSYTWSKSIDDLAPGAGVTGFDTYSARPWDDPLRHQFDRGPSEFDHTHRFVGSYVWQLPGLAKENRLVRTVLGDWQFNGIVSAQTGRPITIFSGVNNSGTGIGLDRANIVGAAYGAGACAGSTKACIDWLNPAAFVANPAGTFGNLGKGSLRFPGFYSWDMSLAKNFSFTERYKLQFRAEFFNVFNRVNFDDSIATGNFAKLSAKGSFGALNQALDPRIGQLALKLFF